MRYIRQRPLLTDLLTNDKKLGPETTGQVVGQGVAPITE